MRLISRLSKIALLVVGGPHPISWNLEYSKRAKLSMSKREFSSQRLDCLWTVMQDFFLPSNSNWNSTLPGSWASWPSDWNYTIGFPWSAGSDSPRRFGDFSVSIDTWTDSMYMCVRRRRHTYAHIYTHPHIHMYISYWFCFSGEPWWWAVEPEFQPRPVCLTLNSCWKVNRW